MMKNEIWKFFGPKYRCHCQTQKDRDAMLKIKGAECNSVYQMPDGTTEWDVDIDYPFLKEAMKILRVRKIRS